MFSLIEHIEYLIINNDCVIVPGWGAFVAQYSNAIYDANNQTFTAPNRIIVFNPSISHNDALLAQSIVHKSGVSYNEALEEINLSITNIKQQLQAGNEVPFGHLGFFKLDDEGLLNFTPFHRNYTFNEFYGLGNLNLALIATNKEAENEETAFVDEPTENIKRSNNIVPFSKRFVQIAASIAVLLCLTLLLTTPISFDSSKPVEAGLNLPKVTKQADFEWSHNNHDLAIKLPKAAIEEKETYTIKTKGIEQANETKTAKELTVAATTNDWKANVEKANNVEGRYYLVVSSLTSQKQVDKFMAANPGINAQVLERNGKYRIYVARSNNYGKLMNLRNQLPSRFSDSWICD